jgi:uncharacterized membrane protein
MDVAVIAAVAMVCSDVLAVIMVQAEADDRGWLAGTMDTAGWLVAITTTTVSVTALQGHSFREKVLVVLFVSAANLLGTKLGQIIGKRWFRRNRPDIHDLAARVAKLESDAAR